MNLYHLLQEKAAAQPIRVGIIGAGKFSSMFLSQARLTRGMHIAAIAELELEKARQACLRTGWSEEILLLNGSAADVSDAAARGKTILTEDVNVLIQSDLDVIIEMTGVPEAGVCHAWKAIETGKHVVMVNVEADALVGSALRKRADKMKVVYSMAYGDQPALITELVDWARTVGLEVVCAGKGTRYQPEYHYSTPETVWQHYGFTEDQVASGDYNPKMFNSFLDGSKSAIEMCAVSNACGLLPQRVGLQFPAVDVDHLAETLKPITAGGILEHSGTVEVVASENRNGSPLARDLRWGVYIVFRAPTDYVQRCFREYGLRTDGTGQYATLYRPYHLIGLELGISVASAVLRREPTGSPQGFLADVASVAKKELFPGEILDGEGGHCVFGKLVQSKESLACQYLPLGLTSGAKVKQALSRGSFLTYKDVEINEELFSFKLRKELELQSS